MPGATVQNKEILFPIPIIFFNTELLAEAAKWLPKVTDLWILGQLSDINFQPKGKFRH